METQTKHTPTPWYVTKGFDGELAVNDHLEFPSEFPIATIGGPLENKAANAQFIVTAVNNHHRLLAALEGMRAAWDMPGRESVRARGDAMEAIRAAIAAATQPMEG